MEIRITSFGGIIPRVAERLLPDAAAQLATNAKLASGELRPMRKAKKVYAPSAASAVESIIKLDDSTWFVWPIADVHVARSPIEGDPKYCYTGDGVPKITTKTLGTPVTSSGTPAAFRALGIPAPLATPGLGATGGVGSAVSRYYGYTFVSDWSEEGPLSPVSALVTGKVDDTWAVSGMDSAPSNSGGISAITYIGTAVTVTSAVNHFNRIGDVITIASVSTVSNINGTWTLTGIDLTAKTMSFTVASAPSGAYNNGTDTTDTWARQVPWGTCTKRIYRTAGTLANWQMVADGVSGTSYNDTLTDAQIPGDDLVSATWSPPPAGLSGLIVAPNGSMIGFEGNIVHQSEPYQPHAWPSSYQRKAHFAVMGVVGLADGSAIVVTDGMPYLLSGVEPATSILERIEEPMPCLSARSICSVGDSAVFSTRGGLARVGPGGRLIFTADLFSDEDWYELSPETMRCAYTRGSLYLLSDTDPAQAFVIGIAAEAATRPVVTAPLVADALHVDSATGKLYYAYLREVFEFDPDDGAPMAMDWWSKEFVVGQPVNMGAAKVVFSEEYTTQAIAAFAAERDAAIAANAAAIAAHGARGGINQSRINALRINGSELLPTTADTPSITFMLYVNGRLKYSRRVLSGKPFRLPEGYKSDVFSARVTANTHVRSIEIAETMQGLKRA